MEYLSFCLLFWEKPPNRVFTMATDKGQTWLFKKAHALFRLVFLLFHCQSFIGTKHVCVFGYNHLHILTRVMQPGTKGNKNTAHICSFAVAKLWLQWKVCGKYEVKIFSMFQDFAIMFEFNCALSIDLIGYFLYALLTASHITSLPISQQNESIFENFKAYRPTRSLSLILHTHLFFLFYFCIQPPAF